jgi:hypothetical protein
VRGEDQPVKKMIPAAGVTLAAFVVYWRTLLPSISAWGDGAKFQYIAQVWGIPHTTGYPLYIPLTRLFSLLPFGDVAYRVNLLSAVCAAAAAGCLALAAGQVTRDRLPALGPEAQVGAAVAALMLAFSPIFWSQAVVAEVYALNALFVALCLGLLLCWRQTGRTAAMYAFLLVYGLSFSHHLSMILLLPAFLFLIAQRDPRTFIRPRNLLFGVLGVLLGLAPYAYILLRAAQGAVYSEFPPLAGRSLLDAFVDYVSGAQFRSSYFAVFERSPAAVWAKLLFYADLLLRQFGWWGIALGLLGLLFIWRRDRPLTIGLVLAFLGEFVFALGYEITETEVYFIPAYMLWAVFVAAALGWLLERVGFYLTPWPPSLRGKGEIALALLACLALPIVPLVNNWAAADQSDNWAARRWGEAFMRGMEPGARVVLPQPYFYSQKEILLYLMLVEGVNPGLEFIEEDQIDAWAGRRPVYLAVWMPEVAKRYKLQTMDSSELTLARFLEGLPAGTVVIAAAKDEASLGLSQAAAQAWQKVGGQADLRGCFRCAHALVGVVGAAPGSALEKSGRGALALDLARGDAIGASGVRAPADIAVRSAGFDDGNVGDISVNGRQVSPQHRGYNVVALDPASGQVLAAVYADTFESDRVNNVRKYRLGERK